MADTITFAEAARLYMEEKERTRRANTVEGYRSALNRHVLPRFGALDVSEIDPDDVQEWVRSFERPGAAEKAYKTLRQVLRWTVRKMRLRMWLPTEGVELPRKPAHRPRALDAAQLAELQRGMWGHALEALVLSTSDLGLRPGEGCALNLERDVDWRTGEVRVGPSRQTVRGEVMEFPAKTEKSDRTLAYSRHALKRLRQLRRSLPGGDLLQGLRPDQAWRRVKAHCLRAGLPWAGARNLRHSWATLAVEAGVGVETVAMMLGHTDIGTAYEHYIRPRLSICRGAQEAVERMMLAAS